MAGANREIDTHELTLVTTSDGLMLYAFTFTRGGGADLVGADLQVGPYGPNGRPYGFRLRACHAPRGAGCSARSGRPII